MQLLLLAAFATEAQRRFAVHTRWSLGLAALGRPDGVLAEEEIAESYMGDCLRALVALVALARGVPVVFA